MKASIIDRKKGIEIQGEKINLNEFLNYIDTTSADEESTLTLFEDVEKKYTIKFNYIGKNKWKVDYPIRLNNIHKQRYLSLNQCLQVIEMVYNSKDIDLLKGFIDVPVKHFTLDDMLEFKREDEMMLRGEDPDKKKKEAVYQSKKAVVAKKSPIKKTNTISPKKKESISKVAPTKKTKPKTAMTMGENLNAKKAKPTPKKGTPKLTKEKPKDDNSFFQI